jgi:uncharacterized membrane protein YqaE (UPF0057 family)
MDIFRLIIAVVLPPVGVFLQVGFSGQFFLNILLTLLGYFPGIIHAVWIIARREGQESHHRTLPPHPTALPGGEVLLKRRQPLLASKGLYPRTLSRSAPTA